MAQLSSDEILKEVKKGLGITTDFQNDILNVYIEDVKAFCRSAGVKESVINSNRAIGCILRGVIDLWNYGSGSAGLSDYFKMRVTQLAFEDEDSAADAESVAADV